MVIITYAIIAMLIIIAVVEYMPPMVFSNFLLPTCIIHIANSNRVDKLNNVVARPLNKPVPIINTVNKKPAFVKLANVHFVRFVIQRVFTAILGFLSGLFGIKYPGIHSISKPNGIEQIIFHSGIFIVRARRKHAHNPIIVTPNI